MKNRLSRKRRRRDDPALRAGARETSLSAGFCTPPGERHARRGWKKKIVVGIKSKRERICRVN